MFREFVIENIWEVNKKMLYFDAEAVMYVSFCSKIVALGFDEKFIRTWEYYFEYCSAGFKSRTLGDYQVMLLYKTADWHMKPWS